MASLIGTHNRSNGIKQIPSRAVLSLNGAGLGGDETHADTITILRDTRIFPDGEAPPDWRTYDGSNWQAFGEYWYAICDSYWQLNPADYYQITNEQGGGEGADVAGNYEQLVKVERAISQAANADGRKCCILNLAGGSPGDFELWKTICAPFIVEAWENGGNIYGRHVYGGDLVDEYGQPLPGQPERIIQELDHLKSIGYMGGVVLTECGLDGGYGVADYNRFSFQVTAWEAALRPYADMLIGFCWWEMGASEFNADYTNHMKQLLPYLAGSYLERWQPPIVTPPDGGDMTTITRTRIQGADILRTHGATKISIEFMQYNANGTITIPGPPVVVTVPAGTTKVRADVYIDETFEVECPANPNPPPVLSLARGALGIDISAWQPNFWDTNSPDNWDFFIFRCSDGLYKGPEFSHFTESGVDVELWDNATVGHESGKPWGIYHYLRPGQIEAQAAKVLGIYQQLIDRGTPPRQAIFDDGRPFAEIWPDVERPELTNAEVKLFCDLLGVG